MNGVQTMPCKIRSIPSLSTAQIPITVMSDLTPSVHNSPEGQGEKHEGGDNYRRDVGLGEVIHMARSDFCFMDPHACVNTVASVQWFRLFAGIICGAF